MLRLGLLALSKVAVSATALVICCSTSFAQDSTGGVTPKGIHIAQGHDPEGTPYWYTQDCFSEEDCQEAAYEWCKGPYHIVGPRKIGNVRFLCDKPKSAQGAGQ
jgi:hypothetical protein